MKRLFIVALCLFFSQSIWAQKFSVPAIPEGNIGKSEYAKYEKDFIRCMDWLENHSPSAKQRKDVNAFVLWWLSGTPDLKIELNADAANFENGDLLLLYMGGWGKYSINNSDTDKIAGSLAGFETVISYYQKYKDSLVKDKLAEKLAKMKEKGTLRQFAEKSAQ